MFAGPWNPQRHDMSDYLPEFNWPVSPFIGQSELFWLYYERSQRSSGVEQRFRKPPVVSSNLTAGSTCECTSYLPPTLPAECRSHTT